MIKWGEDARGVVSLAAITEGKILPPGPLFSGFLLDNTLTMLSAPPFVGKSLLLGSMMLSLDSGLPLLNRYPPADDKRVLMIAQDAPSWDYAGQLTKLARGMNLNEEQRKLLDSTLVLNRGIQVTDKDFFINIERFKRELDFNVLILDAFWTIHGLNENDQSQMGIVMSRLKRVRDDYETAVIFAHHDRKPVGGDVPVNANYKSRGASTIPASVDFNLGLSRSGARVKVQLAKARGSDDESLLFYDIMDCDHPEGPAVVLQAVKLGTTRLGQVLAYLAGGERRRSEIVAHMTQFDPDKPTNLVAKHVDHDLKLLRAVAKVENVRHGVWGICAGVSASGVDFSADDSVVEAA